MRRVVVNRLSADRYGNESSRRTSSLGEALVEMKFERARSMSPEERLLVALELSDLCMELQRACYVKPWQR